MFAVGKDYLAMNDSFQIAYYQIYRAVKVNEKTGKVTFKVRPMDGGKAYQTTVSTRTAYYCEKADDERSHLTICSNLEAC